jgi:NAD(P)-dependent dehydrogenase (short-subunit alcohol dehydrogenase family)
MLAGKVCAVTGSTAGIGKGIARAFLQQGAFVFINGRSEATVAATIAELAEEGLTETLPVVADLGAAEGCEQFFAQVEAAGKDVDVFVNNMGIFEVIDFFEADDEKWLHYFNTNVMSTVRCCRKYLKHMLARDKGRIIIVSSEAGLRPIGDMLPYSMTKAAQINIARGLAELTKGTNVTVNSLLPGPTATEGVTTFIGGIAAKSGQTVEDATTAYFVDREPTSLLQRFLRVEEIAHIAMFLASDMSSGINGAAQLVDGGIIRHI